MSTTRTTSYARTADGAYIGYQTMGAGDVTLMLGSYGNISIDSFDEMPQLAHFLDALATFARVLLFDWRGVGLSDPLSPNTDDQSYIQDCVNDVLAVLDATDTQPSLLAWLNSGPIAVTLAAQHPERLHSLVLVNTFSKLVRAPGYEFGLPPEMAQNFDDEVIEPGGDDDTDYWIGMHAPSMAGDESFTRWWTDGGRRGASPATAHRFMRGLIASDARDQLPSIAVPTLVLHGRDIRWYTLDHGRYFAEHIPDAKLVELPSADMTVFTTASELAIEEIEEFLTGDRHVHEPARELMTVLFTDIVDSTSQLSALGNSRWRVLLDEYETMAAREVHRFRGRVVKTTGDGLFAVFDSPARAIRCASAMQERSPLATRAGVHTGEVELRGADVGGFAVHAGQRVCATASSGEVLVSRTVAELVAGSGFDFTDRGEHELRGLPGSWQLFAVN